MSAPTIVSVSPNSPAEQYGIKGGEQILTINGCVPRDVIEYQLLIDEPQVVLEIDSGGIRSEVEILRKTGTPLGIEVDGALFDRVRTCDNHCEFCFIYQLPPGLRKSLYLKDDDYRLSFLYGNFTTLTRFTEADLERVLVEGLSPLYVSIHSTDPHKRAEMLRNRRGATSLRWLSELLENEVTVHGQVVVCPGVNDGYWLEDTLAGVAEKYSDLASLCIVPLGVSKYTNEPRMRPHTKEEANAVIDCVESWQDLFVENLGRHLVHAADEYYLAAGREFPAAQSYGDFEMFEDGIGMARAFELEFTNHDFKRARASLGVLRLSLGVLGLSQGVLGASLGVLGASLGCWEPVWAYCGLVWACCCSSGRAGTHSGVLGLILPIPIWGAHARNQIFGPIGCAVLINSVCCTRGATRSLVQLDVLCNVAG